MSATVDSEKIPFVSLGGKHARFLRMEKGVQDGREGDEPAGNIVLEGR